MQNNKALGDYGERIAERFLRKKGYAILESNFRCRAGEIDIICGDGSVIVFVEVKYRKSLVCGSPGEAVNAAKMNKIRSAALHYIYRNEIDNGDFRFDVIEIFGDRDLVNSINHIKNAFYA